MVVLKRAIALNSMTSICFTKLDVLDELEEIAICVGYEANGKQLLDPPYSSDDFDTIKPIYETLPGWQSSTFGLKNYDDLPKQAQAYIERVEALAGIPISIVSTGPERDQTIWRGEIFK